MNPLALLSLYTPEIAGYAALTSANKAKYAFAKDFACIIPSNTLDPNRPPSWSKLTLIARAFDAGYPWVLWMDADTLIVDYAFDPLALIDDESDFIFATDCNGMNLGVFLMRNCYRTRKLMHDAYLGASDPYHRLWEQRAIDEVIQKGECRARIKVVPQAMLNSYVYESNGSHGWVEGDPVIHFAGFSEERREIMVGEWLEKVKR